VVEQRYQAVRPNVGVMICSVNAKLPEWNIVDCSATRAALAKFAKSLSK
jgi:hypothetical protein